MARTPRHQPGLPSREQILEFIEQSKEPAGKREISRAFGLHGSDKIALKALLKDMADEGLIDGRKSAFYKLGGVPRVTVLKIVDMDGNQLVAVPERWEADGIPLPKLRVAESPPRHKSGGKNNPAKPHSPPIRSFSFRANPRAPRQQRFLG